MNKKLNRTKLIEIAPQLLAELERLVDLITDPDGAYVTLEDCDLPKELIASVYEEPSSPAPLTELAALKAALKLIASKEVNHPLREYIEDALNSCKKIANDALANDALANNKRACGYLCHTCGIGYYLPSNVCDHCNTPAPEAGWFCSQCDKPMAETDAGYSHTDGIVYCSEECARKHDANL